MPIANQLVQVGHACLEAGKRFNQPQQPCSLVLLSGCFETGAVPVLLRLVTLSLVVNLGSSRYIAFDDVLEHQPKWMEKAEFQERHLRLLCELDARKRLGQPDQHPCPNLEKRCW